MSVPSVKKIWEYWEGEIEEGDKPTCMVCWATSGLERAHIVARSLGGPDVVENLVLLCKRHHEESPDTRDPAVFWSWVDIASAAAWQRHVDRFKEVESIVMATRGAWSSVFMERAKTKTGLAPMMDWMGDWLHENASWHGFTYSTGSWAAAFMALFDELENEVKT